MGDGKLGDHVRLGSMGNEKPGEHRDLIEWQKARYLTDAIYRATASFPSAEIYGLTSKIRRAAVSVPSNLAEGSARRTSADFISFLHIARGSQAELDTQIRLVQSVGYLPDPIAADLLAQSDQV